MNILEKYKSKNDAPIDFNNNICQDRSNNENDVNNEGLVSREEILGKIQLQSNVFAKINNKNIDSQYNYNQIQLKSNNIPNTDLLRKDKKILIANAINQVPTDNGNDSPPSVGLRVKRPMNAFMVWSRERRRVIAETSPQLHNAEISRILGIDWKKMSEYDKKPFYEAAKILQEQHHITYPNYKYKPRRKKNSNITLQRLGNYNINKKNALDNVNQYGLVTPSNPIYPFPNQYVPIKQFGNYNQPVNMTNLNSNASILNYQNDYIPYYNLSSLKTVKNAQNFSVPSYYQVNNVQTIPNKSSLSHNLFDGKTPYNILRQPGMKVEKANITIENGKPNHISSPRNDSNGNLLENDINNFMCSQNVTNFFPNNKSSQSWMYNNIEKITMPCEENTYIPNNNILTPMFMNQGYFQTPFSTQHANEKRTMFNENDEQLNNFNNPYNIDNISYHFGNPDINSNTNYQKTIRNFSASSINNSQQNKNQLSTPSND